MTQRAKGGNIRLDEVRVPDTVRPGQTFTAEVDVSNGAKYINPFDGDKCGLAPPGYKINVEATGPDGEAKDDDDCLGTTEVGVRTRTYTFDFTAPQSGEATVSANVTLRDSGEETGPERDTAEVSASAPENPDDPQDDEANNDSGFNNPFNGGGGDGGGDGGGGGLPIPGLGGGSSEAIVGLVALLAVAWIISSSSDVVEGFQ